MLITGVVILWFFNKEVPVVAKTENATTQQVTGKEKIN